MLHPSNLWSQLTDIYFIIIYLNVCFSDRGELFVWGKNVRGCLGIGKKDDQYFPWRVRHRFSISHPSKEKTMQLSVYF